MNQTIIFRTLNARGDETVDQMQYTPDEMREIFDPQTRHDLDRGRIVYPRLGTQVINATALALATLRAPHLRTATTRSDDEPQIFNPDESRA